jgi:hypothetical protein
MKEEHWTKWSHDIAFYIKKEEIIQIQRIIKKITKTDRKNVHVKIKSLSYLLLLWFLYHYDNLLTIPDDFPLIRKYKGKRYTKLKKFQNSFQKYYKNIP